MGWFGKKNEESVESKKEETAIHSIFEKSNHIAMSVANLAQEVSATKDRSLQMIHMSGRREADNSNCLAVIGSPEGLCELLFAAGMKEGHMARILIYVGEKLANASAENAAFKEAILKDNEPCTCPACTLQEETVGKIGLNTELFKDLSTERIESMTEEEMDEFVKKAIDSTKPN
jgi:hypothetical protein